MVFLEFHLRWRTMFCCGHADHLPNCKAAMPSKAHNSKTIITINNAVFGSGGLFIGQIRQCRGNGRRIEGGAH